MGIAVTMGIMEMAVVTATTGTTAMAVVMETTGIMETMEIAAAMVTVTVAAKGKRTNKP